jgi:hypothetical protein
MSKLSIILCNTVPYIIQVLQSLLSPSAYKCLRIGTGHALCGGPERDSRLTRVERFCTGHFYRMRITYACMYHYFSCDYVTSIPYQYRTSS